MPKDPWDKVSAVTPLLIGIFITGLGGYFTHIYNFRQLQLLEITTIDKFRPLLTSENIHECEYAYSAILAINQEELVKRLTTVYQDQCGRSAVEKLKEQGSEGAAKILETLDKESTLELKELVSNIYSSTRVTRRNATAILASDKWLAESQTLVQELISAYKEDPSDYFGLVNTLFLLQKVSNETFKANINDIQDIVESGKSILSPRDKVTYLTPIENKIDLIS